MDKVNALPASESDEYRGEYDVNDDNINVKCQSPDNVGDDEDSSASSSTHSTSGVVSASSPGSQRDFYSTVSGAGDTYPLDSSEGARPRTLTNLNLDDTNMGETSIIRSSTKEFEENNRNGVDLRNISKEWSNKAQMLNRSINTVLENIPDPKKVDVNIGKAAIKPGDKTVILALNKKKPKLNESIDSGLFSPPGISDLKFAETQDGIVLYCTIRLRDDFQDSNDVETLAIKDVFRQACLSPDHTVPNINLDAFDLGEKFRGRFGSPDGKSPRSKKSPRRSPNKGSPRKSNSEGEDKDSEGTFTSTSSDLDDEEYATERENEAYKHRKGVGIGDDDDYRTMRSRPSDGREGSPKKSVTWRKELDGNTGGVGSNTNEGTKNATGDSSKTGSRESSASSPRRTGSGKSKTSDDDSPKSGSRSGSLSPKRRGSGDSKASSTSPRRRGSNESKGSGDGSSKSSSRRSSGEQSPRKRSGDVSKRGSGESIGYDENQKVGDQYDTNEVSSDRWGGDEYDNAGDQSARSQPGARSRALKRSEDTTSRRRYRSEYQGGRQVTDSSYDGNSLGDERRLFLNLDGSATSNEKDRLVKRHRKSLRRRRQRAELLTTGKPFDVQLSETEGDGVERRPRTKEEKRRLNELRRKYLNPDVDALEDGDYQEHDPDYDRMGDERHDNCFLPFVGYDENYDGPIGVLTSKLPDGTSTAEHDPIVISQKEQEKFRHGLFNPNPKLNDPLYARKAQPPLHVFNGSDIKPESFLPDDINGNRSLWRAQQIPNRIRRLRSRHIPLDGKLWLTASNSYSFNSRCPSSYRFDRKELDEDSRQYYFYRSLPRIHPSSVGLTTAGKQGSESIFLGGPVIETPSTPPAKRAAAERAKMREGLLL